MFASLLFNNSIISKYQKAVSENELWSKVRLQLRFVETAASSVDEPGNNVFESKSPQKEDENLQIAISEFNKNLNTFKSTINSRTELANQISVLEQIKQIELEMQEMKLASKNIFDAFSSGNLDEASLFMAKLDQRHLALKKVATNLAMRFAEVQNSSLTHEEENIQNLRSIQFLMALLVIMIVVGVVIYGRNISRFVSQTTKEILESRALYQSIVHASSQIIWEIDDRGHFQKDHGSWTSFTGISIDNSLNGGWYQSFQPDEVENIRNIIFTGISKKLPFEFECKLKRSDGAWRTLQISSIPKNADRDYSSWIMAGRDVTESRSIENRLKETNFALDQAAIVAFVELTGKITYANDKFCSITGYSREELIGQDHRLINSGHHTKDFFKDLWRTIASGKIWRGEVKNKRKDGTFYWVDSTIIPVKNLRGEVYQYIAIRYDITQKKDFEEELNIQRQELDQFFELSTDLLSITNVDGSFKKVSASFTRVLGFTSNELKAMSFLDIIHPKI